MQHSEILKENFSFANRKRPEINNDTETIRKISHRAYKRTYCSRGSDAIQEHGNEYYEYPTSKLYTILHTVEFPDSQRHSFYLTESSTLHKSSSLSRDAGDLDLKKKNSPKKSYFSLQLSKCKFVYEF